MTNMVQYMVYFIRADPDVYPGLLQRGPNPLTAVSLMLILSYNSHCTV
jgi:hypothetical protein